MADTNKQSLTTENHPLEEKHTTQVLIWDDRDYVVVAGSSKPNAEHGDGWLRKQYNQLREALGWKIKQGEAAQFINHGIRQLREYQQKINKPERQQKDRSYFIVFQENYDPEALKVTERIAKRWGGNFVTVNSSAELVAFINGREAEKHRIQQWDMYAHGLVEGVEFGYDTDKMDSYRLGTAQVELLQSNMFHWDAVITSYACRTGIGVDKGRFELGQNPRFDLSLAQKLADYLYVTVYAFARRSNYKFTYGNDKERKTASDEKLQAKVMEYDRKMEEYQLLKKSYPTRLTDYQKALEAYRKSGENKKNATEIPGRKAPVPPQEPKKDFGDREGDLARHEMSRKVNEKRCGIPIDEFGAVGPVVAGETPKAPPEVLPTELIKFRPIVTVPIPPK